MEVIYRRRSIRKYTAEEVPMEQLLRIIKAGMNAPSAGDEQPWAFIVIDDRKTLEAITAVHPHSRMLKEAPAAILLCGDLSRERHEGFWVQDCAAAAENMLLAVTAERLGSVWLGVFPREDRVRGIRRILGIPEKIVPFALFPVGHPDEEKVPKDEFHREMLHYNSWGEGLPEG
ncbi:MAG: nitroreductase family protein [Spirochaetes bacterium]|nr:nitroreductase family protein [Spirochaetota bacterium]